MSIPHDPWVMPCGERSDRVVEWFDHKDMKHALTLTEGGSRHGPHENVYHRP
ncbi:hypothetical protein JCM14469_13650 [Desulfatiferula olefinivorans]